MGQPSLQMSSAAFLRDRGREAGGLGFANGEKPPARQGRRGPRCSWYHPKNPKRLCLPITSRPRTTNLREIALKTKRARAGGRPAMMFPWVSRASRVPSVSHRTNPAPSRLPYCPAAATRLPPSVPRSFADSQTSDSKHRKPFLAQGGPSWDRGKAQREGEYKSLFPTGLLASRAGQRC
ncbi:uncharacterized protein LOC113987776 isoform X4 [Pipra filicauda]|uniref:Uncharacterized protein LOC113987776 isoform X4 n=1 Tax=Pipra filicauda TaxID=649802 RepID=A0A7R5KPJ0_9PASS|nr:uncharacterized protein LOC113987776 isoform X4 [Pipra filicauda]